MYSRKKLNFKITSNLTKDEQRALKETQLDDNFKVHEFEKGFGFAIGTDSAAKENIEEKLGKATKVKIGLTNRPTSKVPEKICKLRKENKVKNKTYFEFYTFSPIPQCLYGTIKVHKQDKKLFHASHYFCNRYITLKNIKISCRYHSVNTQQKSLQSKKRKIICFTNENMEN